MSSTGIDQAVQAVGEDEYWLSNPPSIEDSRVSWPDNFYLDDFGGEFGCSDHSDHTFPSPHSEFGAFLLGEDTEGYPLHKLPFFCQPEYEEDVEKFLYRAFTRRETVEPQLAFHKQQDLHRKSLFVHSSPTHFPDVNQARKSAFGSIFLRTTGHGLDDSTLLRTVADSSYSMLHSLLNSYEKIISSTTTGADKKQMAMAYKQSLLKALEMHGISRTHADGSIHWNIYPITNDFLFSVQIGDHIHQTRMLSRIEDRIISGSIQRARLPYAWPTDSVWTGHWDALGMAGVGTYIMPHGVSYNGKMVNGYFHDDDATLTYPNKFKALHCVFVKGELQSCQFQFPDMLMHEKENWGYCQLPDRRFWSEVRNGLKPAKNAQKTEIDPPRKIPDGYYDTNDGFYDPKTLMLVSPTGDLLRVPVCAEDQWIKKYCRKGFQEPTDFRPDLFENWYNYDRQLIQSILNGQANYRTGKMNYDEIQQYYADLNILPSWAMYKRRKSPSEIALEQYLKSIPEPVPLRSPWAGRKVHDHRIPSEVKAVITDDAERSREIFSAHEVSKPNVLPSKSFLRFTRESKMRVGGPVNTVNVKSSRISFKLNDSTDVSVQGETPPKRKIPEKYLEYRPILNLPFNVKREIRPSASESGAKKKKKKCLRRFFSAFSGSWDYAPGEFEGELHFEFYEQKGLRRFMKRIILELVTSILKEERERHRKRYQWAQKPPHTPTPGAGPHEKCLKVLEELFESIPDKEEFCDSDPHKICDFKKLAEDKYKTLKYWGKRIYMLNIKDPV